ncbi:MAG: hypothetical protein WC729_29900 [Sphingomonas sp.]|jgi:hypothetical protein|uniref:hypothetical protein n=1 Tax=Sphingomonas sp. TaxID=28214 RepID=UPI00356603FE
MPIYTVTDGHADLLIIADSPEDAAQRYVGSGDWGEAEDDARTQWIDCIVIPLDAAGEPIADERETITVTVNPVAPRCRSVHVHDWQSLHEIVGGLKENPGVHGHGGGVVIHQACRHCGARRRIDTWAQRPDTGEQGMESVSYHR